MKFDRDVEVVWTDKKRNWGMPISFTTYAIIRKPGKWTKLIREMGFLHTEVEEIQFYRIDDIGLYSSLVNSFWGVGNVDVYCSDATCKKLRLERIKNPNKIKNLINDLLEEERTRMNVHNSEIQI